MSILPSHQPEPMLAERAPAEKDLRQWQMDAVDVRWRELLAVALVVALADLVIYRGHGFAGLALLFVACPPLLVLGSAEARLGKATWIVAVLLALLSLKLVWCGSALLVLCGFVLLTAFAMRLAGLSPFVLDIVLFALQALAAGWLGLMHYGKSCRRVGPAPSVASWVGFGVPALALLMFGSLFILANPHLVDSFRQGLDYFWTNAHWWISNAAPYPSELLFWLVVTWLVVGQLRPILNRPILASPAGKAPSKTGASPAYLYPACRNTLIGVTALFAIYLAFEFHTMWFREFPPGFYYSGYAHEGAAWLTLALALATVVLSLVFRGSLLADARLPMLRRLAWIWSLENFLLAIAVYNRLSIYIGFNGMTRMRIVGILGMTSVVVGFILVLWKIARNRDFIWLLHRQMWTLAFAIYLYALLPVDMIVVRYNVGRILAGDPAPSVQITVHPISEEGVTLLRPLLACEDLEIREGVRAMLANRDEMAQTRQTVRLQQGWTAQQLAEQRALRVFRDNRQQWSDFANSQAQREAAIERFRAYAYQWY